VARVPSLMFGFGRRKKRSPQELPDPAMPPGKRGTWDEAALTNVAITELVKQEIKTVTRPQNR
jgi:hypothetical protein